MVQLQPRRRKHAHGSWIVPDIAIGARTLLLSATLLVGGTVAQSGADRCIGSESTLLAENNKCDEPTWVGPT